jgi:dihydroceramide fatty acyl 2-hydroxylase
VLRATPESPKMFESDFLDLFSRTHWSVVPIMWVPVCLLMLTYSVLRTPAGLAISLLLAFLGFVAWTLTEYWLHRLFFHWMPPAVSITLYFVFLALFYPIFGSTYVWSWHAGFVLGYVFYDCTHYYLHHYTPKSAYGIRLKKNHMLHHFKDHDSRFCVSNMLWDRMFGTIGEREVK